MARRSECVRKCAQKALDTASQATCPRRKRSVVWATQCEPAPDLFNAKAGGTAWRAKPSWYIVAKNDRTIQPDCERILAERMGATTTEVASSHVVMLSQPQAVIDVIRKAVKGAEGVRAAA